MSLADPQKERHNSQGKDKLCAAWGLTSGCVTFSVPCHPTPCWDQEQTIADVSKRKA